MKIIFSNLICRPHCVTVQTWLNNPHTKASVECGRGSQLNAKVWHCLSRYTPFEFGARVGNAQCPVDPSSPLSRVTCAALQGRYIHNERATRNQWQSNISFFYRACLWQNKPFRFSCSRTQRTSHFRAKRIRHKRYNSVVSCSTFNFLFS
jgi:hypothetical protein